MDSMKVRFARRRQDRAWVFALVVVFLWMPAGCAANRHAVIASTGTTIGLEVSQNPTNQIPEAKLGYNRAEFAYVPTNRSTNADPGRVGEGAKDSANVLMELKYSNIFGGDGSGIYQRLAVGDIAVKQPGATLMFLRDVQGTVGSNAAPAVVAALEGVEVLETNQDLVELARQFSKSTTTEQGNWDAAAKKLGFDGFGGFLTKPSKEQIESMKKELVKSKLIAKQGS